MISWETVGLSETSLLHGVGLVDSLVLELGSVILVVMWMSVCKLAHCRGKQFTQAYTLHSANRRTLTFQSLLVTWCINSLTFNNCTLCPHCIYVFCIYLRTNSDLYHLQYKLIGFYNQDEKCLQRGTDWVLPEIFLFLKRNERDMIKMLIGLNVKTPLILSYFN
jgi:hypothetical protein